MNFLLYLPFLSLINSKSIFDFNSKTEPDQCSAVRESERINCYPELNLNHKECLERGCCYNQKRINESSPVCFFGQDYGLYKVKTLVKSTTGVKIMLELYNSVYTDTLITDPLVEVEYNTRDQLRIKISDSSNERYQVPLLLNQRITTVNETNYVVEVISQPFALIVTRKVPEMIVFDTRVGPLIFADQFLSISTSLGGSYIHGIGERWGPTRVNLEWKNYPLFNADHRPEPNTNGYGTHPFYTVSDGTWFYGTLFYNSNAQEFVTQPSNQITWRSIGGIFDIYLFMGPTPMDIMNQYTDLIGRSMMPPYWSLGFHLCKWGYTSTDEVRGLVQKMKEEGIPQDGQWTDIDYMDNHRQFTFSWDNFGDLPELSRELHGDDLHHIIISEPHVAAENSLYQPYSDGVKMNAFIHDKTNKSFVKQEVWPGECHYVDYGSKSGLDYWTFEMEKFHKSVKFDGIWIDMNDPSSFSQPCDFGKYNYPPYIPQNMFYAYLYTKTICMDAIHADGIEYDVHSVYATLQAKDTFEALRKVRPYERPFIISRSSFVTHGYFSGTWSGDSVSTFYDMKNSISAMIRSNMFGISMTGGDICGFAEPATEKLCTRWYLFGAFYPFMRSHADHADKTPFAFSPRMTLVAKKMILERYRLLPYLYTLFYQSNVFGSPVIQPLFMRWHDDVNTYNIEEQFTWGSAILFSPAFESDTVVGYFPKGMWYDYFHEKSPFYSRGQFLEMDTPIDKINIHVYGGNIIPVQKPAMRTKQSRNNPFSLLVFASSDICGGELARGELFSDDGVSFETYESRQYSLYDFSLRCNDSKYSLTSSLASPVESRSLILGSVEINGVTKPKGPVTVNGVKKWYSYDESAKLLVVDELNTGLSEVSISWS